MRLRQWKKHLKLLIGCWIFPAILSISISLLLLTPSWLTGVIFLLVLFRIFTTQNKYVVVIGGLFAFLTGIFCLGTQNQMVSFPNGTELEGTLVLSPDQLKINGDQLTAEGSWTYKQKKQKIRISYRLSSKNEQRFWRETHSYLELSLQGTFHKPISKTNLNGFDYQDYLKQRGITQVLSISTIKDITPLKPSLFRLDQQIVLLRTTLIHYCTERFSPQTGLYLKSLLLGEQMIFSEEQQRAFSKLGMIYLFSMSGYQVSFLLFFMRYLCLRVGLTQEATLLLTIFFSCFIAGITGFTVSVIRALLQKNLQTLNRQVNARLSALDCWGIAALLHLVITPHLFATFSGQFSYYLSFLRFVIEPILQTLNGKILKRFAFSALVSLGTLPLMLFYFYEWPMLSSSFTFVVLPFFNYLLLPSLTALFFLSFFGKFVVLFAGFEEFLSFQQKIWQWFSQYTFTYVTGALPISLLFFLFFLLLFLFFHIQIKSKKSFFVAICLFALVNSKHFSPKGVVAFIDVGQGDSIFIQTPFKQETVLIDTGGILSFKQEAWKQKATTKANAEYTVIPFLKSQGVQRLDKVLITHGHVDHYGDLLTIHQKIPIRHLYYPAGTEIKAGFSKVLDKLTASGTSCFPIIAPQQLSQKLDLQMIAPISNGQGENNDSMVVSATIQKKRLLLTGDLEQQGEQELLERLPKLEIDVLKVGHHGSKTATSPSFIKKLQPKIGIISCGRENRFKHPHQETLTTLQQNQVAVYRTDLQGMVYFEWTPFSQLTGPYVVKKEN